MRIGYSSDIHKLVAGRKLILAGVTIPSEVGEEAHSDGDVVYHALAESILGALAIGDLGKYFPDRDETYLNYDSSKIVTFCYNKMKELNLNFENIDISITLESPKISKYIEQMRLNISSLLNLDISQVSVKAGTNEKIDDLGRGLAVKADCIILLR